MRRSVMKQSAAGVRGFSLIEVLISIIVLSFGMLGMVGMQAAALQSNREARLQSVGFGLAQELAEMMRGNKDVGNLTTNNPYLVNAASPLTPAVASYCLSVEDTAGCTGTALAGQTLIAQAQMTEWLGRVDAELPGARVVVCRDTVPYDATSDLPRWACTAPSGTAVAQTFIKIGWTQSSTNRAATGASALIRASGDGLPAIVFPVIAGSNDGPTP